MKRIRAFQVAGLSVLFWGQALFLAAQVTWYDPVLDSQLPIQGRYWNHETGRVFQRLPQRAESLVRKPVWDLSHQTAGLYIKFYTNAPTVQIKYQVTGGISLPHMPATGVSGVDLYTMDCDGNQYWCAPNYQFGDTVRYTYKDLTYHNTHSKGNEFTLYLPLYNGVKSLQIGVPEGCRFDFVRPSAEKPVIVYGTSITQGACASRPGMAWTNILQRKLDMPVVNLGFSGNGQLDQGFFKLLSETDAAMYVIDCMPNMTESRTELIRPRLEEGLRILRSKSQAPILLVEHDGYMGYHASDKKRLLFEQTNEQLQAVYESMKNEIGNLHYLTFEELGLTMDSQVDGVHANDLGMQQYADAYYQKISRILFPQFTSLSFVPCRQHRDSDTYQWIKRHDEVLTYNKQIQPEIVMIGNSITHFWGGMPFEKRRVANEVWQELFNGKTVVNMGYGWDRIENVQWRILHGELDGFQAKQIFMMLGTNNLDTNTDEEIMQGIKETAGLIASKQPDARLYIIKILPRRDRENRLRSLNAAIEKALNANPNIQIIDLSQALTGKDGKIDEQLFSDGLHPNLQGYKAIAHQLEQYIK